MHITGFSHRIQPPQSTRKLLAPSRQSEMAARGSGVLLYQPTGFQIDGADLTQFFMEAHSNYNVTGAHDGSVRQSLLSKHSRRIRL